MPSSAAPMSTAPVVKVGENQTSPYLFRGGGPGAYPPPGARTYGPGTRIYRGAPRYRGDRYYRSHRYYRGPYYRNYRYRNDFAAGALGLGLGFALGNAIAQPRYYRRAPAYAGACRPWTRTWYARCSRFKTFNPRTGYYFYKPGKRRFCTC